MTRTTLMGVVSARFQRHQRERLAAEAARKAAFEAARTDPTGQRQRQACDALILAAIGERMQAAEAIQQQVVEALMRQREGLWAAVRQRYRDAAQAMAVAPFVGVALASVAADRDRDVVERVQRAFDTVRNTLATSDLRLIALGDRFPWSESHRWPELEAAWISDTRIETDIEAPVWRGVLASPGRVLCAEGPILGPGDRNEPLTDAHLTFLAAHGADAVSRPEPSQEAPWDLVRDSWRAY